MSKGVSRSLLYSMCLALAVWAAAGTPAEAQILYGSLVGGVTDAQGSAVPGARVEIVNTDTNFTRETTTDSQGALFVHERAVRTLQREGHAARVQGSHSIPRASQQSARSAAST